MGKLWGDIEELEDQDGGRLAMMVEEKKNCRVRWQISLGQVHYRIKV